VSGRAARQHVRRDAYSRVRVFADEATGLPLSVTDEFRDRSAPTRDGYEPVMTWTWEHMRIGPLEAAVFELPALWTHARCSRHIGGWPYLHLMHTYLRV